MEVEMIAAAYEWTCPDCGRNNREIEVTTKVTCVQCGKTHEVRDYHHAIGK